MPVISVIFILFYLCRCRFRPSCVFESNVAILVLPVGKTFIGEYTNMAYFYTKLLCLNSVVISHVYQEKI